MKKVLLLILTIAMVALAFASCQKEQTPDTPEKYTIGIIQLAPHEALDAATNGFMDAVKAALGEDKVEFKLQNAAGDTATCTTIAGSFVAEKVDLIMANATPAVNAAYGATAEIPILGTSVTEYGVALDIENFNGVTGCNVSGTSDLAPLTEQADMLIELFPEAKKVGILYCSAEANSEYQVKVIEEYLTSKGLECTRFSFSDSNDIATVTEAAASASDVIYIPTDNTAATAAETIGNIVRERKIPVIAGESGLCQACGVASLSISYYDLGVKTGEMAVKVLKGEANISEMPIEYAPATKVYNPTICAELGIEIPEGYVALS